MDGGAWKAAVHGVSKSRTWLSDFTFTFHFHALEKEMATHSSVLAWRIPGTREPGGLPSMGSHRVGHDWSGLAAAAAAGLTCRTWDLWPSLCMWNLELQHVGNSSLTYWTWGVEEGLNLGPLHCECRVLATGPPENSSASQCSKHFICTN